ncbi:UNC93A [Bugula neritina]|uniref:UNC93A n=1 Tax=Bugula neritina TaxID=10212 RepID=A0A7J7JM23_BUGNE|nr:UNC93A [Bugula neritina]
MTIMSQELKFGGNMELSARGDEKSEQDSEMEFESITQIWRNGLVMFTGFLLLFTAFQSLQFLQSSLFIDEGMGTTVLAVIYGSLIVSAFFLPSPMIGTLGCKWTLSVSMGCYIMYMAAHFYARWELFVPAAVIVGMGAAPLWASKSHYLNLIAHNYAKLKGVTNDAATNLFFGVFFLFFQSASVWGNIISSQVLTPDDVNSTITPLPEEELALCGKAFDPTLKPNNTNLDPPPQSKLFMLAGIYSGCACLAVTVILLALQQLPSERSKARCGGCTRTSCSLTLLASTFLHLRDRRQLLLIPITMFSGLEQAFFASDYMQAFVTCPLGSWWVGYVAICYGVVDAICSASFGKLVQYFGRIPFFILGAAINVSLVIAFLTINVTQDRVYIYFVFAGLWGMADAVWQTQINALYGVLFIANGEAAFSNYRLFESIGFIMAFGYQSHLILPIKAYILLTFLCLGMAGYGILEYLERKNKDWHLNDTS